MGDGGKTPSSSTSRFPFVRRLSEELPEAGRRLRLATVPSTVEIQSCPAGYFCPPGSIAQMDPFTGEVIYVSPMACTRLGIVCAEGSFNPLSIDVIAQPGQYVAPDGSGVLPCPVGIIPCCPPGSYCPPGVITLNTLAGLTDNGPRICPPGLYCMAGTSSVIPDPTSMNTAKQCTQGTFCVANTTTAGGTDNCPPRWPLWPRFCGAKGAATALLRIWMDLVFEGG
eukprot:g19503.t1